jgi:hypothetical protein
MSKLKPSCLINTLLFMSGIIIGVMATNIHDGNLLGIKDLVSIVTASVVFFITQTLPSLFSRS